MKRRLIAVGCIGMLLIGLTGCMNKQDKNAEILEPEDAQVVEQTSVEEINAPQTTRYLEADSYEIYSENTQNPEPTASPEPEKPLVRYDDEWLQYRDYDEPLARVLRIINQTIDTEKQQYIEENQKDTNNGDLSNECWGYAYLSYVMEKGYGLISKGLFPNAISAQNLYEYMTVEQGCMSYYFRTCYPFETSTLAKVGDLVYLAESEGNYIDVGIITDVTDTSIIIAIGRGDRVKKLTVTKDQFESNETYYNARIQRIDYQKNSEIVKTFLHDEMGLNWAVTVGIMANMSAESNFSPVWVGDNYKSFGICQWHNADRWTNLRDFCWENGLDMTTLNAQLQYFRYELIEDFPELYETFLHGIPETKEGCSEAAVEFCRVFENPSEWEIRAEERAGVAVNSFWPCYVP